MFVLQEAPAPFWLDVAEGIRLQLKPVGTETLNAGRRAVRLAYREAEDADAEFAFLSGAVQWAAVAWEGVGDAEGHPLPISAEAVHRLLQQRPDIYAVLDAQYVQTALELLSEKKGSSPSPSGTSAEGQPTATPAPSGRKTRKTATPVRTGKTSARPRKGSTSGAPSGPAKAS